MAEDRYRGQDCDQESAGQSATGERNGWILGHPLPKKLGIKPGIVVALVNAPDAFERTLDPLPNGVLIKEDLRSKLGIDIGETRILT